MTTALNKNAISVLCRKFHVKKLYAFGSVLTDRFNEVSDIDFLVDFESIDIAGYADNYFDFKYSLQDMLNRKIDLVEEKAIKNPYFKQEVNSTKTLIYER